MPRRTNFRPNFLFAVSCLVLFPLSPQSLSAQTFQPKRENTNAETAQQKAMRRSAILKRGRFLGWNYARKYKQDMTRWTRQTQRSQSTLTSHVSTFNGQAPFLPKGNTGFGNAGFGFRGSLPAGFIPTAVVAGDFNQDGHMDVAISNGGDNTIYVLLGNGDGTFQVPEILYTQGQSPTWITAVSLRNNGILDLVVTDGDSQTVEVFLGNGDGTFAEGGQFPTANVPTFVVAGDFNNDGKQDLAIGLTVDAGALEPQFEILLGDGTGGFSGTILPPPILAGPDGPVPTGWIASGDVNNDGYTDLVLTVAGGFAMTYMNQGGTAFTQGTPFGPADDPLVVGLGDMDEDGCLDAVELGGSGMATIAKGTCDGNFTQGPPIQFAGDLDPAIKIVDVDGDGHLDVVGSAVNFDIGYGPVGTEGGYVVSVMKGDGNGNLTPAKVYRGGTDEWSLAVADFTGDNKPDILTVDSSENEASVYLNDGSGNYDGPQGETMGLLPGSYNITNDTYPIKTADINGDGKPDLYLVEQEDSGPELTAILNDGTGKFLAPIRSPIAVGPSAPYPDYIADGFRNPSIPDVIYITKFFGVNNTVAFIPGNGDGTFGAATVLANPPNPLKVVSGDFNGDGKKDFAVVGLDISGTNWEFDVFLGHGDGTFTHLAPQIFPIENLGIIQQLFALDLNHDGKLDLLIGNNDNGGLTSNGDDLIEALGNGDGTFQTPTTLIPHFGAVAIADVNHDGFPDLIQGRDPSNYETTEFFTPAVTVYLGTADGTFLQQPSYDLDGVAVAAVEPVLVGDFNGDGNIDIVDRHLTTIFGPLTEARLTLLQGVGDGTFVVAGHKFQLQGLSDPFVGADFNGDGATDLVEYVGYTYAFHTINAAPSPSLDIALDSSPILGSTGSATVTLDLPAASAETVTLSASDPAIQLPGSLTFTPGEQRQSLSFTLGSGFDATHVFALYATLGGETAVAYDNKPNPNSTTGVAVSLNPSGQMSVTPGENFSLDFALVSEGGYQGTFSSLQCTGLPSGASCSFDANSMVIPEGGRDVVTLTVSTSSSTPYGTYPVLVSSTDGFFDATTTLTLGIGNFSISIDPSIVAVSPAGTGTPTVTSTSTNGLNELVTLVCNGLPANAGCIQGSQLSTNGGTTTLSVASNGLAPGDYPFQIVGTANIASRMTAATLRVGDFTASLDKTTATISPGNSATFNVTLKSVNHYASAITVTCEIPVKTVSCAASPSPDNLTDGGTSTVQLVVSVAPSSSTIERTGIGASPYFCFALLFLFLLPVSFSKHRTTLLPSAALVLVLGSIIACGGSRSSGTVSPPPPPPAPQTVNVSVLASSTSTIADPNNQKTLGPIVVTIP